MNLRSKFGRRAALVGTAVALGVGLFASPPLAFEAVPPHTGSGGLSPAPPPPLRPTSCLVMLTPGYAVEVPSGGSFTYSDATGDNYQVTCEGGATHIRFLPVSAPPRGPDA